MKLTSLTSSSIAVAVLLMAGSTSCLAGGGRSYSPVITGANGLPCPPSVGAVNPFVGAGGRDHVAQPMIVVPTTSLCHTCGVPSAGPSPAIYQPRPASIQNASLVGGIGNTQQTGGSVTGGNVSIGGASAATGAFGGWGGWGHHGGDTTSTPTATSTTNAVVNYTNTNQTTNTTTNNISDSFNTTTNTTINKTYNIDNSSNVNFNFFVLGNSNAINTGSGSTVISDSANNVGNAGGSSGGGRRPHRGIWNSSGMTSSEGGSSGGDVGEAS